MRHFNLHSIIFYWILVGVFTFPLNTYSQGNGSIKPIPQINKEFLIVVHTVHLLGDSTPADKNLIETALNGANTVFQPIGASFKICEYRDIYNFNYALLSGKLDPELTAQYHIANRINLFLIADFTDKPACGNAVLGGVSMQVPTHRIVIKLGACLSTTTIAHELGHYFGLPHTFEQSGVENADGSNCATAGDGVCDTPADPFSEDDDLKDYITSSCEFYSTKKDANGQYYNPDVSNLMGYYSPCRCLKFTRGQYEKMANYYLNNLGIW